MNRFLAFALMLIAGFVARPAQGHGTLGGTGTEVPAVPAHLYLVKNCEAAGWDPTIDFGVKCFQTVLALNNKIWGSGGIMPTASNPLTVDIGPGEFLGRINCPTGQGHVTFRGAGRDHTIIKHTNHWTASAVKADSCNALGFQDLKLVADGNVSNANAYAVLWIGGGSSSWSDVDLVGEDAGWYDATCPGDPAIDLPSGTHYFWGSTVRGGRIGYYAQCSDSWFYGGEIAANASISGSTSSAMVGVWVAHLAEVHTFGSAIRVSTTGLSSGSGTAYGARVGPLEPNQAAEGYGEFHSHGGVISVNTSDTPDVDAIGLSLENNGITTGGAKAHTLETGFAIKGDVGASTKRLSGTGSFESPHLWEARIIPPPAGGEIDGQEMYVETDCNAAGCTGTGGSDPHVMIYTTNPLCEDHWFDLVRRECRD